MATPQESYNYRILWMMKEIIRQNKEKEDLSGICTVQFNVPNQGKDIPSYEDQLRIILELHNSGLIEFINEYTQHSCIVYPNSDEERLVPTAARFKILQPIFKKKYLEFESLLSDEYKIKIIISGIEGILGPAGKKYEIRGKRFDIIKKLLNKNMRIASLAKATGKTQKFVKNAIPKMNELFIEKLGLDHKVIVRSGTSGMHLNKDVYDFIVQDI